MRRRSIHDPLTGQSLTFLETGRETGGERLRAELRLASGGRVPRHSHFRILERFEVVDGRVEFRLGRQTIELVAGDAVDVPRRTLHRVRNVGDGEARCILEVRPARRFEALLRLLFAAGRLAGRVMGRRVP